MSKFCVKLGAINKKLSFPFFLALVQIVLIIFELYFPEQKINSVLSFYSEAFAQTAIIIIPYIKCLSISNQKEKTKCQCSKKNCLHYFILLLLYYVDFNSTFFCCLLGGYSGKANSIVRTIFDYFSTKVGIEIILIAIITKFLLKYEYFIHHYISIFLFLVFCVSIDLLLNNYSELSDKEFLEIFLNILCIITRVGYLCYIKYMIDRHYHYYWNIIFSLGITQVLVDIISTILIKMIFNQKFYINEQLSNILKTLEEVSIGILISKIIIYFIFYFIFHVLQILTIFYLSPEYIFISQSISRIIFYITYENNNKYICIIIFLFQFFILMIYLEILEFNFLNLNKNTKRNIKLRIDNEQIERTDSLKNAIFEVGNGYIFELEENEKDNKTNLNVELKQL